MIYQELLHINKLCMFSGYVATVESHIQNKKKILNHVRKIKHEHAYSIIL